MEAWTCEPSTEEIEDPITGEIQTVKIQLIALGLIAKSQKARSVKDSRTFWALTPYGDQVLTRLRAIRRGPGLEAPGPQDDAA